jgi:segregation and condensation protein B
MEELEITGDDSPEQDPQNQSAPAGPGEAPPPVLVMEAMPAEDFLTLEEAEGGSPASAEAVEDARLKAVIEALVYVAEDPITVAQVAASLEQPAERIGLLLGELMAEYDQPGRGIQIREVAGGYRMATKAEHHDAVREFVGSLKPPLKLSLPALETLAVIAYKQPVTAPEVKEIRGVQGTGVLSTLLDRKLIAEAGRKNVIGKPILYKTTKEFLIQFGLKDLSELPTLKEFEEIRRMAMADSEPGEQPQEEAAQPAAAAESAEPAPPAEVAEPAPVDGATEPAPADAGAPTAESAEPAPPAEVAEPAPADAGAPGAESAEPAPPAEVAEPALADAGAPGAESAEPAPAGSEEPVPAPPAPED